MRKVVLVITCALLGVLVYAAPRGQRRASPASVRMPGAAFAGMETISSERIRAHVHGLHERDRQ